MPRDTNLAFLRTSCLAFDLSIVTLFGTMTRSRSEKVICLCSECYPGKEVALRTKQTHLQVNPHPKIPGARSQNHVVLSDFYTNEAEYVDTEMEDYSDGEDEMGDSTGMDLMIILTVRR